MSVIPSKKQFKAPREDSARMWFQEVVERESAALKAFLRDVPATISDAVGALAHTTLPVACLGVGKSGLVAAKIAATLSSLGTPAFFLNPAEAAHGDLGAVQQDSCILVFSNSGTTKEILGILPALKARECVLVGIIGSPESPLARACDIIIAAPISGEADHIGMAPTASTTLQMAIGDGLAVAAAQMHGFDKADFLRHHPAGLLGRQAIAVRTIMRSGADLPKVLPSASIAELLAVMSAMRMGAACVVDHSNTLIGLVVDGDIRRHFQTGKDIYAANAGQIMHADPCVIHVDATLGDAMRVANEKTHGLLVLPVTDDEGQLHGLLHTGDMVRG